MLWTQPAGTHDSLPNFHMCFPQYLELTHAGPRLQPCVLLGHFTLSATLALTTRRMIKGTGPSRVHRGPSSSIAPSPAARIQNPLCLWPAAPVSLHANGVRLSLLEAQRLRPAPTHRHSAIDRTGMPPPCFRSSLYGPCFCALVRQWWCMLLTTPSLTQFVWHTGC